MREPTSASTQLSGRTAIRTSAFSLKAIASELLPRMRERGGAIVSMDFDARVAWPIYDWMGELFTRWGEVVAASPAPPAPDGEAEEDDEFFAVAPSHGHGGYSDEDE